MRVLLAPHGTRGDVQPMVALALELRARGHAVSFSVPSNFLPWIRTHGFDAASNGVDAEAVLRAAGVKFHSVRWQLRHLTELTPVLFDSVVRASEHADIIVGAGVQLAGASIAEWRKVRYIGVAFCPCAIPSSAAPPPTFRTQTWPPWVNRLLWQIGGPLADFVLRGAINRGRATLGLAPIDSPIAQLTSGGIVVAADRDLGPLGDDAPASAVGTDAWILEEPAAIGPRVEAFLALDPAPIYIGFGSMTAARVPELAAHAVAAARAVGRAAIISGGWASLDRHVIEADDLQLVGGALPHHAIFPRVAAVVHHGGAGTTTAAARSGVPQVILPHILDQYYWGHRVERLGLGPRALPVDLVTADMLADRLDAALNDARIRERAATFAGAIGPRNGVTAAVDHLEQLARCPV